MTDRIVYIVDDEEPIRRSCKLMLRVQGYEVATFDSGTSLLNVVKALTPGCILLDVRMPGLDGLEVQKALNEKGSPHSVIVMTGHGDIITAASALRHGATAFIEKPFSKAIVNRALDLGFLRLERPEEYETHISKVASKVACLSDEQKLLLANLMEGKSNDATAVQLGIEVAAVEMLRAQLLAALRVDDVIEALWIAFSSGLDESSQREVAAIFPESVSSIT